jgi:hypothetical protein
VIAAVKHLIAAVKLLSGALLVPGKKNQVPFAIRVFHPLLTVSRYHGITVVSFSIFLKVGKSKIYFLIWILAGPKQCKPSLCEAVVDQQLPNFLPRWRWRQ